MIVMPEDGNGKNDFDKVCLQQLFGKNPCLCFRELVVPVLLVVGVLVALWWCVRTVLTVLGDVLRVLLNFGGVCVVCWECSGGVLAVLKAWRCLG